MRTFDLPNRLIAKARRVNDDLCWPATEITDVIQQLARLDLAILGLELWIFEDDDKPRVTGWTDYKLELQGEWDQVVRDAAEQAEREILEHVGNQDLWINLQWITKEEVSPEGQTGQ